MKLIIALVFGLSSIALASEKAYDLKIELTMNGQKVSSPRLIVKSGETGSVTQEQGADKIFMDVVAIPSAPVEGKPVVQMNFVVGKINADGSKTVLSTPKLLTHENSPAQIFQKDQSGKDLLSLSVVPTSVSL